MKQKGTAYRALLGILFMALFTFLLQLWIKNWKKGQVIFTYKLKSEITPTEKQENVYKVKRVSRTPEKDDLTIISGIGPVTAAALQNNGITSIKQISDIKPELLINILKDAKLRAPDVNSWITQSKQIVKNAQS